MLPEKPGAAEEVPAPIRSGPEWAPALPPPGPTDEDLLSLILGKTRGRSPEVAARSLLAGGSWATLAAREGSLPGGADLAPGQRARLFACLELARRAQGTGPLPRIVSGPADVYAVTAELRSEVREHFVGIYLNTRNRILARETISVGTLNAALVHPREVFGPALRLCAATVVVAHNHPSGETDPSEDDLAITRRLAEAGELLGISLLDHVIVGARGFTSLKELGHRFE